MLNLKSHPDKFKINEEKETNVLQFFQILNTLEVLCDFWYLFFN
jgi:hypothetical protein